MIAAINITINVIMYISSMLSYNVISETHYPLLWGAAPWLLAIWVFILALGENISSPLPFEQPAVSVQSVTSFFSITLRLVFCDSNVTTYPHSQLPII